MPSAPSTFSGGGLHWLGTRRADCAPPAADGTGNVGTSPTFARPSPAGCSWRCIDHVTLRFEIGFTLRTENRVLIDRADYRQHAGPRRHRKSNQAVVCGTQCIFGVCWQSAAHCRFDTKRYGRVQFTRTEHVGIRQEIWVLHPVEPFRINIECALAGGVVVRCISGHAESSLVRQRRETVREDGRSRMAKRSGSRCEGLPRENRTSEAAASGKRYVCHRTLNAGRERAVGRRAISLVLYSSASDAMLSNGKAVDPALSRIMSAVVMECW